MTDHAPQPAPRAALRPDIQGLRAVAVVAVVLDHAIGWPSGGFAGVDVFFVISGFLITGLLLRDVEQTGRVSFRDFYAKRVRRILPAALVVLVVVAAAAFVVFNVTRAWQTFWDAVYSLVFAANWHFAAQGTDYFHASDAVSPLQHFWSLSVEEQFYLVWPGLVMLLLLLLPAALRRGRGARLVVAAAAVVIVGASFAWAMAQTGAEPTVAYFSTVTRAWELGVGALLAAGAPLLLRVPVAIRAVTSWIGLVGVLASFVVIDGGSTPFPGPGAALPVIAAALLVAGGVGGGRQRHLFPLTNPLSTFVGDISYSLYLWHFPVIVFLAVLLPEPTPTSTALALATIVALALVSYFLVEQPFHRSPLLQRFRGRPLEEALEEASAAEPAARPTTRYASATAPAPRESGSPRGAGSSADTAAAGGATRYAAGAATTRPAGWTPGSRYSPASVQRARGAQPVRPATPDARAVASSAGAPPTASARPTAPAAAPAPDPRTAPAAASTPTTPATASAPTNPGTASAPAIPAAASTAAASATSAAASAPAPAPRVARTREEVRAARRAAWRAWRERYSTQWLLSGSGLVVVVVLLALAMQFTLRGGAPLAVIDLGGPPAAGQDQGAPADPTPILQNALAQALDATEWPDLNPSLDAVMSRTSSDNPARSCFDPGTQPDFGRCTWGSGSAPNHMYLVGDSTAMAYAPAFKKLAEQSAGQWRITTIGLYGCRFTDVLVRNDGAGVMDACPQRKADIAARIAADAPQLVVVSNAYALGTSSTGTPLSAASLVASTQAETAKYGVPGRILYLAPPPLGADLGTCYSPLTSPSACAVGVDPAWHDFENATEAAAAASGDHAMSSLPFSCVNEMCPAFAGTLPLKYDETHLTVAFSESLSAILRYDLGAMGLM